MTDKELMSLMLYGECRGESQYGKLCCASTVMNRLQLAQNRNVTWWGSTVAEIIQAPLQYQGFQLLDIATLDQNSWLECCNIADQVLNHDLVVPEITHFVTIDYPDFVGMEYKFTVGNHKFFQEKY